MFTTFHASAEPTTLAAGNGLTGPDLTNVSNTGRPKRHQVSRACCWCRTYRIKCDDEIPCRNCVSKGRKCSLKANEVRTFAVAVKEISRLKSRLSELEDQLKATQVFHQQNSSQTPCLPENLDPLREHGGNRGSWQALYVKSLNSQHVQSYGPSSSFYFMKNMSLYLENALSAVCPAESVQLAVSSASTFLTLDVQSKMDLGRSLRRTNSTGQKALSKYQEDYFLDMFWTSYHCIYPIIDESEFRAHHKSIWIMPYEPRRPSALVDIMIAVMMQYGTGLLHPDKTNTVLAADERGKNAATAGLSYYRRCQALLADQLENPSITTLQCQILSVIYLSNGGSPNTAHSMLASACRVAIVIGIHREPPSDMEDDEKNFRRRLWWTLYSLEIRAAMDLGRPMAVKFAEVTCNLPADAPRSGSVMLLGSTKSPSLASCFTCNLQYIKLVLSARAVFVTFYDKCSEVLSSGQQNTLYGNIEALETCAEFLVSKMEYMDTWIRDVPESLKTKRRNGSGPFSTLVGSSLDISPLMSFCEQRLVLELIYHTLAMNLFRHFITFSTHGNLPQSSITQNDANAVSCVCHAMTITSILHQVLTETDLLSGCIQSFHWHKNAFLCLIGYTLAYPAGKHALDVRKAIETAISTFDIFSRGLAIATSSAQIARDLYVKVELVVDTCCMGPVVPSGSGSKPVGLQLNRAGHAVNPSTFTATQDVSQLDLAMAEPDETVGHEPLFSDLLHSFDPVRAMDWTNEGGDPTTGIWTPGQGEGFDLDMDSFNRWLEQNSPAEY